MPQLNSLCLCADGVESQSNMGRGENLKERNKNNKYHLGTDKIEQKQLYYSNKKWKDKKIKC